MYDRTTNLFFGDFDSIIYVLTNIMIIILIFLKVINNLTKLNTINKLIKINRQKAIK
jgi:hypothetical protein